MGWASRLNPESRENKKVAEVMATTAWREYQPGDLKHGDVVTIGNSPTRWRVSEKDGAIFIKPVGQVFS